MSASATAQVNARINPLLKDQGDAGLAAAGLTPTKAVHALWELAARYRDSPEKVIAALYPERIQGQRRDAAEERQRLESLVAKGPAVVERAYRDFNMSLADSSLSLPLEDQKAAAYQERFGRDVFGG